MSSTSQSAQASAPAPSAVDNPSFLIIDDHMLMRKVVTQQLQAAGYEKLDEAKTGAEALEKIDLALAGGRPFDVVFIDWGMSEMDGITFLKECRSRPELNDTALVMLTGESERTSVMEAIGAGATAYIVKPVSAEELIEKVGKIKEWLKKQRNLV